MEAAPPRGVVHSVNVSDGGVPKRPVARAQVSRDGLEGDRQRDLRHHGGPDRAVSLFGLDVIERLRREGHPIAPGTTGENLTLADLDWSRVGTGDRLAFDGGLLLEVTTHAVPCGTIRASFQDGDVRRIAQDRHPGESRLYARVLVPGPIWAGAEVTVKPPPRA